MNLSPSVIIMIYQKGNLEVADEILSSDFVLHNPTLPE